MFAEVERETGVQDLDLSAQDAAGGLINLKFVRFQNVSSLTVCWPLGLWARDPRSTRREGYACGHHLLTASGVFGLGHG